MKTSDGCLPELMKVRGLMHMPLSRWTHLQLTETFHWCEDLAFRLVAPLFDLHLKGLGVFVRGRATINGPRKLNVRPLHLTRN